MTRTHIPAYFFILILSACASKEHKNQTQADIEYQRDQQEQFTMREAQQSRIN